MFPFRLFPKPKVFLLWCVIIVVVYVWKPV